MTDKTKTTIKTLIEKGADVNNHDTQPEPEKPAISKETLEKIRKLQLDKTY